MDLDGYLVGEKAHLPGGRLIINSVYRIDLNKMIACPQSADLVFTSSFGPVTDLAGVGTRQTAIFFGPFQVRLGGIPTRQCPVRSFFYQNVQFSRPKFYMACFADTTGTVGVYSRGQIIQIRGYFLFFHLSCQQTHAAVNIVTDTAGGDNAVG